ncbi:MAG: serine/threonine protein kinase, partial [Polyangiaceae bacterium]|nr:serine/threonine protein kinase [Polyangiaceae bacterium]
MSGSNENSAKPKSGAHGPAGIPPATSLPDDRVVHGVPDPEQGAAEGRAPSRTAAGDGDAARSPGLTGLEQTVLPSFGPASHVTNEDCADPLLGTVVAGRYRLEALLGVGGMGRVYRAEHVYMRKLFALKVLHGHMTLVPEVVARFEREAVAAARIEHPNVAKASDFGRLEDGAFYLALEFVEGVSLRGEIQRCGTFTAARAVDVALQMARALTAAHAEGIVHRDLKPENVMLITRSGRKDHVKVLDFGIAKLQAEDRHNASKLTQVGSVFGTPEYMSPEQAMGQPVDPRSDLYSVGIILYEMLAGHTPFAGGNMAAVLTRQMTAEAPPLPSGIPSGLRNLVTALLSKPADERVASAQELCRRLEGLGLSQLPAPWPRRAVSASSRAWAALVAHGKAWEGRLDRAVVALTQRVPRLSFLARPVPMAGRSVRLGLLV